MENPELEEALSFDPLAEAERLTGADYKESETTAALGLLMAMGHSSRKDALLTLARDTRNRNTMQEFADILYEMGFGLVAEGPIAGTSDKWRIFWRRGILLFCESYLGFETVNSATAYFNFRFKEDGWSALHGCSHGPCRGADYAAEESEGVFTRVCSLDAREGFRHRLGKLEAAGEFLDPWVGADFMWLVDYKECKQEPFDYKSVNAVKIGLLPEEVRKSIAVYQNQT